MAEPARRRATGSLSVLAVLAVLLLVLLISPCHGQYYSGYGTGPFIPGMNNEFPGEGEDANDPKYDDAKSASSFASFYYGLNGQGGQQNIGRNDQFPRQESPYKYRPPLYPSVALGTIPPQLPHPLGGFNDLGYFK